MKKMKLAVLFIAFTSLLYLTNCEDDVSRTECGKYEYLVTQRGATAYLYAEDLDVFEEDVTVVLDYSEKTCTSPCAGLDDGTQTITVKKGAASPYLLLSLRYQSIFNGATITSPSCPEPTEKTQEDIESDSKDICNNEGTLTITEDICYEETVISWESDASLEGVTYTNYGVSFSLAEGSSKTFASSELDFDDVDDDIITGGDHLCSFENILITCPATCDDGIQNGDEEGVDCGGSCGNTCQADSGITYAGTSLDITYASYIDFISVDGNMVFTLTNDENVPYIDITLNSSAEFVSETYTVGGETYSVDTDLSSINASGDMNGAVPFTSGSVVLTIGTESYTLDINLTTSEGTLSGTYDVPFGE